MNEYLGAMTTIVRNNRGTLDKYIGDAIMAFWGRRSPMPNMRAMQCTALDMQRELRRLDEPFKARGWPMLHIGVGINTGTMTVGDMGSPVRKAYTVMGDAVNLGSRLEGIIQAVRRRHHRGRNDPGAGQDVVFRELDRVRVRTRMNLSLFTSRSAFPARSHRNVWRRSSSGNTRSATTGRRTGIRRTCRSTICCVRNRIAVSTSSTRNVSHTTGKRRRVKAGTA